MCTTVKLKFKVIKVFLLWLVYVHVVTIKVSKNKADKSKRKENLKTHFLLSGFTYNYNFEVAKPFCVISDKNTKT